MRWLRGSLQASCLLVVSVLWVGVLGASDSLQTQSRQEGESDELRDPIEVLDDQDHKLGSLPAVRVWLPDPGFVRGDPKVGVTRLAMFTLLWAERSVGARTVEGHGKAGLCPTRRWQARLARSPEVSGYSATTRCCCSRVIPSAE